MRAIGGKRRGASSARVRIIAMVAVIVGTTVATLLAMGRAPVCPCGHVALWAGDVRSDQNSQQIADWYSLSHIVHGLSFYALGWLALRRWAIGTRFVLAVGLEAGWEILENSPVIIDRYRAVTMAFGYSGDSVLNSVSDIAMMIVGYWLAARLPWRAAAALVVVLELVALVAIRDGFVMNVWMLIAPNDAIRAWQTG